MAVPALPTIPLTISLLPLANASLVRPRESVRAPCARASACAARVSNTVIWAAGRLVPRRSLRSDGRTITACEGSNPARVTDRYVSDCAGVEWLWCTSPAPNRRLSRTTLAPMPHRTSMSTAHGRRFSRRRGAHSITVAGAPSVRESATPSLGVTPPKGGPRVALSATIDSTCTTSGWLCADSSSRSLLPLKDGADGTARSALSAACSSCAMRLQLCMWRLGGMDSLLTYRRKSCSRRNSWPAAAKFVLSHKSNLMSSFARDLSMTKRRPGWSLVAPSMPSTRTCTLGSGVSTVRAAFAGILRGAFTNVFARSLASLEL
mmetsp:Transcript_8994/g.36694  ORF Transcript_8994/g.36694 Transcript_8994/m.36694 type:complete len:319 (-) Transcript_8994:6881-7837(-)